MTKKTISVILAVVLMLSLSIVSFAAAEDVEFDTMVIDIPDILTDDEEIELDYRAWEITQKYGCAVYIMISDTLEGYEAWEYNEMLHRELSLGYGEDKSAVILLLSMEERQYDLMAHGFGNTAFTDYGKSVMEERFLDDFANDDWYWGFVDYLDTCEEFLELAVNGEAYDVGSDGSGGFGETVIGVVIAVVLSCLIAMGICLIFRAQMKTARKATEAHEYAKELNLTGQYDRFSHRDVRRVYNPPREDDGGTTVNSNGSSHSGGSF